GLADSALRLLEAAEKQGLRLPGPYPGLHLGRCWVSYPRAKRSSISGTPWPSQAVRRTSSAAYHSGERTPVAAPPASDETSGAISCSSAMAVYTALSPVGGRRSSTRVASLDQPSCSCAFIRPASRLRSEFSTIVHTSP